MLTWVLSGLLAVVFLAAGLAKLLTPREKLLANRNMGWVEDFSEPQVKGIGALEVLGAVGVVLPWLLDIAPVLTPIAAFGLAGIMVGAMATHLRRGEAKQALPVNLVLGALALAVGILRVGQL